MIISPTLFLKSVGIMKTSLKLWRRRFLTPLGKITVIKSLTLPKITLLMALSDPEQNILNNINGMFLAPLSSAQDELL